MLKKFFGHLKTIRTHRKWVRKICFKCGYYKRGFLHDRSKFKGREFWTSVKYWNGKQSPYELERAATGTAFGWLQHKGMNPHHWEFWVDFTGTEGESAGTYHTVARKMEREYMIEMICDWVGAALTYGGEKPDYTKGYPSPKQYYDRCKPRRLFHPDTLRQVEVYMGIIATQGIDAFAKRVREDDKFDKEIRKLIPIFKNREISINVNEENLTEADKEKIETISKMVKDNEDKELTLEDFNEMNKDALFIPADKPKEPRTIFPVKDDEESDPRMPSSYFIGTEKLMELNPVSVHPPFESRFSESELNKRTKSELRKICGEVGVEAMALNILTKPQLIQTIIKQISEKGVSVRDVNTKENSNA